MNSFPAGVELREQSFELSSTLLNSKQDLVLTSNEPLADLMNNTGSNTLISCAAPLLAVIIQLKRARLTGKIQALHHHLLGAIIDFETKANQQQLAKPVINSARYILCATVDEIVLNQQLSEQAPWDSQNDWSKQSLVSTFYQDIWGGEKFFEILDHLLQGAEQNIELLELICFCLQLGFQGKYRIMNQGQERLALLREKLYTTICKYRGKPDTTLMPQVKKAMLRRRAANPLILILLAAGILMGILIDWYLYLNYQLNGIANPVYYAIQALHLGA